RCACWANTFAEGSAVVTISSSASNDNKNFFIRLASPQFHLNQRRRPVLVLNEERHPARRERHLFANDRNSAFLERAETMFSRQVTHLIRFSLQTHDLESDCPRIQKLAVSHQFAVD